MKLFNDFNNAIIVSSTIIDNTALLCKNMNVVKFSNGNPNVKNCISEDILLSVFKLFKLKILIHLNKSPTAESSCF